VYEALVALQKQNYCLCSFINGIEAKKDTAVIEVAFM